MLLRRGGDIEKKNQEGLTGLHMASLRNKKEVCKYLLKKGAKVNV